MRQRLVIAAARLAETKYYKTRAKESSGRRSDLTSRSKEREVSKEAIPAAAKATGASEASAKRAAKVLKDGAKSTVAAMESGELSLNKAAKIAALPKGEQAAAVKVATTALRRPTHNQRVLDRLLSPITAY